MVNWAKDYRKVHGLSQQALADKLGISKSLVCLFESGKRKPGIDLLPRIEKVTGLRPSVVRPDLAKQLRI